MAWDFNTPEHFARACMVLVALQSGTLTEAQAATLCGVDPVTLQDMRQSCLDAAREMWREHRLKNPGTPA